MNLRIYTDKKDSVDLNYPNTPLQYLWNSIRSCLMQLKLLAIWGSLICFCLFVSWKGWGVEVGDTEEEIRFSNIMLSSWRKYSCLSWNSINTKKKKKKWNCSLSFFGNAFNDFGMQRHSLGKVTYDLGVLSKVLPGPWAEIALLWLCDC